KFMENLICKFKNRQIPSRFPYEFLEIVEKINNKEILKSELKRIYLRKSKEDKQEILDKILKEFESYEYDKIYFANIFLISKFLADERRV
ncbi:MAG: hypothetical protein NC926_11230, partial [Candidatus Omnitrophica bacterium]|nr:hypothetical protein [Candidatus Omnitrophota bacterium]